MRKVLSDNIHWYRLMTELKKKDIKKISDEQNIVKYFEVTLKLVVKYKI